MTHHRSQAIAKTETRPVWPYWMSALLFGAGLSLGAGLAKAENLTNAHGYSYFGDLKYSTDFTGFDYVNPQAPQGGEMSIATAGTFDSLNPYSRKGRSGALTSMLYDSLLVDSNDTIGDYYGLLAESLEYPEDRSWVIFHMRPEATFSDGTPVTAHDVVYSHKLFLDQGLPSYAQAVSRMVTGAEALDDHTVKFTFSPDVTRRGLIETVGGTPVFSKAWFEADPERRLDKPRLEVAVGSGPWTLDSYDINRRIIYKKRDDYWGKDLPVTTGHANFDTIRIEYFADASAQFEAFKAGEYTFRVEGDPKRWASGYSFPKVKDGTVIQMEIENGSPPNPTGFVFNLGKPQLQDPRVRDAIALAFNFEWANESLLYSLRAPRDSFIEGTHLEAKGVPEGAEKAFLESLGDVVPPALFTEEARTTHTSSPKRLNDRRNLRKASKLLKEAGYSVDEKGLLRDANGRTLDLAMMMPSTIDGSVRAMHETFVQNLQKIGVNASVESVDTAQYTLRQRERDYDMIYSSRYGTFLSTGGGLSQMYGSKEAAFSLFNPAGLASPLVDAIIDASFEMETQEDTNVALMALDRALRYKNFIIPVGYVPVHWVAAYDMYAHPDNLPPYALGSRDFWWIDPDKAAALEASGKLR